MTSNQVAFFKAAEDQRHNQEMERQNAESVYENKRHNAAMEAETHRTNIMNEAIKHEVNAINKIHNQRYDYETMRHNASMEGIQRSYNSGNLAIAREANRIQDYNATTNRFNARQNALNQNRLYRMNVNESNSKILLNYANTNLADTNRKATALRTATSVVTDITKTINRRK